MPYKNELKRRDYSKKYRDLHKKKKQEYMKEYRIKKTKGFKG